MGGWADRHLKEYGQTGESPTERVRADGRTGGSPAQRVGSRSPSSTILSVKCDMCVVSTHVELGLLLPTL